MKNLLGKTFATTLQMEVAVEKEVGMEIEKHKFVEGGVEFTLENGEVIEVFTKEVSIYEGDSVQYIAYK